MKSEIKIFFDKCSKYLDMKKLDNYDIFLVNEKSRQLSCRELQLEDYKESVELGYSIRVMKGNRISFVSSNNMSLSSVEKNIEEVVALNSIFPKDNSLRMPKKISTDKQKLTIDSSYSSISVKDKENSLIFLEKLIRDRDKKIVNIETLNFSENLSGCFYKVKDSDINFQESVFFGYDGEVIAEENNQMESGGAFQYKTNFSEINLETLAKKIADNALSMLGASSIKSGEYKVVFRNDVAASFVSTFISLFSAENVQNNKSILKDKKSSKIANQEFSLIDDGSIEDKIGYTLFDGEGVSGKKTTLIKNGILDGYLYDLKTAEIDKAELTGNAIRSGYDSQPSIRPTNLIVNSGKNSINDFLKNDKVLLITNVMGMHTVNTINGEFSVGASGILYENGTPCQSVRQITIAGDFLNLLLSVKAVADDTEEFPYNGNIITPSWFIEKLMISGL
jgi:PmbA protein